MTDQSLDQMITELRILAEPKSANAAYLYVSDILQMFKQACDHVGFDIANEAFDEAGLNMDDVATREKWLLAQAVCQKLGVA